MLICPFCDSKRVQIVAVKKVCDVYECLNCEEHFLKYKDKKNATDRGLLQMPEMQATDEHQK